MDKKHQKKVDRARKVKIKVHKQRAAKRKMDKEQEVKDRLLYKTRQRQTPIVTPDDSALVRNNKVLQEMMAEHEALEQFREENKEKVDEMMEKAKEDHHQWDQIREQTDE